jgi:hypothetical protein
VGVSAMPWRGVGVVLDYSLKYCSVGDKVSPTQTGSTSYNVYYASTDVIIHM